MSFLCVKTVTRNASKNSNRKNARREIKKYHYVYEAETRRDKRNQRVKHKIIDSIGTLVPTKKVGNSPLPILSMLDLDKDSLLSEVIKHNLFNYGFKEKKKNIFSNKSIEVNLKAKKVRDTATGKEVVLGIHEGYLCSKTLNRLFELDIITESDLLLLVKYVRDVGLLQLSVPKDEEEDKNPKHIDGLINIMSKAMGEEPEEVQNQTKLLIEKHRMFLSVLIKKYPNFKRSAAIEPDVESERISIEEFQKKHGW